MKKWIAILIFVLAISSTTAIAQDVRLLPNLGESSWVTMYDLEVHQLKTGIRYPAFGWKFLYLDGQAITDMDTVALAVGLGIEVVEFARYLGLNVYLSQSVHIGFNGGYNFRTKKAVWGPWGGVNIKF